MSDLYGGQDNLYGGVHMKKFSWQAWVAIGTFLVSFLAMTQIRVQQTLLANLSNLRSDELIGTLVQLEQANDQLQREGVTLNNRLARLKSGQDVRQLVEEELYQTKLKAGLIAVQGPGMRITLADSELPREEGVDPNNYYIHESFIREIVNSFWTGGAEAVSVNGHRMIATSEILCGGTTIFVNRQLISPPYVIEAIGDPKNLRTSINMDVLPSLNSLQQSYGIKLEVLDLNNLVIPAFENKVEFKVARPVANG